MGQFLDQGSDDFPVVCLCGSAGALLPYKTILGRLSSARGMAIVVLSHRAPGNTTLLPLLERVTSLAVLEIQEGMVLEPNHIFLMPPRVHMTMNGLSFHLTVNYRPGLLDSINVFLVSLAASIGARAITVILSGAANDGCAALPAIKAVGGLTFAQSGAEFDSMPRHAIGTGRIDHILSAAGIGDYLARMF